MRRTGQKDRRLGICLVFTIQVLLILTLTATLSHAATVRVPSEQPTIQAGVDAANESDTVLIAPGTYTGPGNYNILLDGKGLVIRSESGPAVTIIDCEGNGRGFTLEGPMAVQPVIEGLTIANGDAGEQGGGILSVDASLIVRYCVLTNNTARFGGAIHIRRSTANTSLTLENCTLAENTASYRGSACYAYYGVEVQVVRCLIYKNYDASGELLTIRYGGSCQIQCTDVFGNNQIDWVDAIHDQYGMDGNVMVHPMMCDPDNGDYSLHVESPLAPSYSPCGSLIGALEVGCTDCYDIDSDGWCAAEDNCPVHANQDQEDLDQNELGDVCDDADGDGWVNVDDNCPDQANLVQSDHDNDGLGDVCDDDFDGDGYANTIDNCPENYNPGQEDYAGDGIGEACCCSGSYTGDANGLGGDEPTIGDISVMIDAKFIAGTCEGIIVCLQEADINQSGGCNPTCDDITIGDISRLIQCLFISSCYLWTSPPCLDDCP